MVARDIWQRKPTSPSGLRPRAQWVYCHISLQPWYNYYIYTVLLVEDLVLSSDYVESQKIIVDSVRNCQVVSQILS